MILETQTVSGECTVSLAYLAPLEPSPPHSRNCLGMDVLLFSGDLVLVEYIGPLVGLWVPVLFDCSSQAAVTPA